MPLTNSDIRAVDQAVEALTYLADAFPSDPDVQKALQAVLDAQRFVARSCAYVAVRNALKAQS